MPPFWYVCDVCAFSLLIVPATEKGPVTHNIRQQSFVGSTGKSFPLPEPSDAALEKRNPCLPEDDTNPHSKKKVKRSRRKSVVKAPTANSPMLEANELGGVPHTESQQQQKVQQWLVAGRWCILTPCCSECATCRAAQDKLG